MQNWDKNAPVLTFLHPLQSMFASFTKHVCILYEACLQAKTPLLEDCKHAIYEAQTWYLRCANMPLMKHDDGFFAKIIHYKYTTFIFYNE